MYSLCEILRFKRKSYSVSLKQPTGRPLCTVCLTGDRDNQEALCSSPGICKQKAVSGEEPFPDSLETAEIPYSVIPISQLD